MVSGFGPGLKGFGPSNRRLWLAKRGLQFWLERRSFVPANGLFATNAPALSGSQAECDADAPKKSNRTEWQTYVFVRPSPTR
jgi:hypothetical protein